VPEDPTDADSVCTTDHDAVVVTGAAGFIGSYLTTRLLADGHDVIGIDNERSGDWSRVPDDCRRVERDLAAMTTNEFAEHLDGVELCFHLAAEKYNSSKTTPQRVIDVNIGATQRLVDAAGRTGTKVVFTSSLYAYGSMGPGPMAETDLPRPTTTYGMSKVAGEHLLRVGQRDADLRWSVARLFFVYGPRQYAEGGYRSVILSNFERIRAGEVPVIFGDGQQALDYLFIDDVVDALVRLAAPECDGVIANVGSGVPTTIVALTDEMLAVAGSTSEPSFGPPDWTAGSARFGDVRHAAETFGWTVTTPLSEGLKRVWHWMADDHD